jgi:hypothetical protein
MINQKLSSVVENDEEMANAIANADSLEDEIRPKSNLFSRKIKQDKKILEKKRFERRMNKIKNECYRND